MDKMEQAFIDGTHPALQRDADAMTTLRTQSPPPSQQQQGVERRNRRDSGDSNDNDVDEDGPRFSAFDPDAPQWEPAPMRPTGGKGGSTNTGVKGVREDHRQYLEDQRNGGRGEEKMLAKEMGKKLMISLDDDDREEDEEKAALERYRQQRMRELQGSGERGVNSRGEERKVFGHLREIGFEQFLSSVEGEREDVAVVLHLYEPDLIPCILLNTHLTSLARSYPHTKFLRCLASELDFMSQDPDDETLPTVLVYRGGELETTWVRFDLELEKGRGGLEGREARRLVEEVLLSKGAVEPNASQMTTSRTSNFARRKPDDDDDDDE